jgi:hypothetical protein
MTRRLLVIAAFDSQLKWGAGVAREFAKAGWTWTAAAPANVRHALSPDQLAAAKVTEFHKLMWRELLEAAIGSDCVVLSLQGPLVEKFTDELALLRQERGEVDHWPVVVTGWVGIIIEKIVAGYLDRAGSDVIAVNSADNLREFQKAGQRLGIPADNLLLSGLPLLPNTAAPMKSGPIRKVVFADQPTIPVDSWDRAYVYQRLIDYATAHPETEVLLKPRHRPEESTFHQMDFHPEQHLRSLTAAPANFKVVYEPITSLLKTTDLLLTVSSTAGLEAVGAGVPTIFIGDLGVHEKHGNHVLADSGLIATFDDLEAGVIPTPDPAWMADMFVDSDSLRPTERIARRVQELCDLPPAERPSVVVGQGKYLSGRLAIRRRREAMPAIARVPAFGVVDQGSVKASLQGRAALLARALLPRSAAERVRMMLRR